MKKNVESITYVNKQSGALMCYMDIDIKKNNCYYIRVRRFKIVEVDVDE